MLTQLNGILRICHRHFLWRLGSSVLLVILAGCAAPREAPVETGVDPPPSEIETALPGEEPLDEADIAAMAAAFRYLVSQETPGETVFLARTPVNPASGTPVAPPPAVFEALEDLPLVLKPATAATITHDPVIDPARPNRQVLDPATGLASTIYWVNIGRRPDKRLRTVETGGFRGYRVSWGFLAKLEKRGSQWYVVEQYGKWRL